MLDKVLTCKTEAFIMRLSYELDIIASRHRMSTIFAVRLASKDKMVRGMSDRSPMFVKSRAAGKVVRGA
jgi:hypothetical protein